MEDETIEAAPSEDNGNVPVETETPGETPSETVVEPETPAEIVEEPAPEPEVPLFETPDGRKVDAETLAREWKENFMPDYTRKSQELAAVKAPIESKPTDPYADPNYVPGTYAELLQAAEERALKAIEDKQNAAVQARQAIEDEVGAQLTAIKAIDPTVNESALFNHATKYGFRDLAMAHANMKDMSATIKKVQQVTAENIAKRSDPVSAAPGATGTRPDPSQFSSSIEYLRSLK